MKKKYLILPYLSAAMLLFTGCARSAPGTGTASTSAALESSLSEQETEDSKESSSESSSAESESGIRVEKGETYQDGNERVSADIARPVLVDKSGEELPANQEISSYIDGLIAEYEEARDEAGDKGHYSVSSAYEVTHDGTRYLSLRIITTRIMASGAESFKTYTVDKQTGELLTLSELLGSEDALKEVSDNILSQMKEQMEADKNVTYFLDPATDGFSGLTGEESFYLSESGSLIVAFDEYSVAPGSMGAVEFTIPESLVGTFD